MKMLIFSLFKTIGSMFDSLAYMFNPETERTNLFTTDAHRYGDTYQYFKKLDREVEVNKGTNTVTNICYSEHGNVIYDGPPDAAPDDVKEKVKELEKIEIRTPKIDFDIFDGLNEETVFKEPE